MKLCKNCKNMADICGKYGKVPPADTYAERCRYFDQAGDKPAHVKAEEAGCDLCDRYTDGWCLQFDLPGWAYNFVKIKEGMQCPKMSI